MKKIGLICLMFAVLTASGVQGQGNDKVIDALNFLKSFGVQAQGRDTVETWRCFAPYDFGKNKVLVELTRGTLVELTRGTESRSLTTEEYIENLKSFFAAQGVTLKEEDIEDLKSLPKIPEGFVEGLKAIFSGKASGQISVAGVTHRALFRITGFERRWDFGEEMKYAFIINPDGSGAYYDFSLLEEGETTKPSQLYDCVLSRSLSSAELPQWDGTQGQPRREKDLQKRPGRKRTADGWVYELE